MAVVERDENRALEEGFRSLFDEHFGTIYRYVRSRGQDRPDVDDVVAEVFLVAWRRMSDVPLGNGARPWLLAVARRVVWDHQRRTMRRQRLVSRLVLERGQPREAGESDLDAVTRAMNHLRRSDRELVRLIYWDDLSQLEAAQVLGCSENAVSIRLHRIRRRLLAEIARRGAEDP
jgi:RNA polymerase sigma-70 factor (ECF subfamily)